VSRKEKRCLRKKPSNLNNQLRWFKKGEYGAHPDEAGYKFMESLAEAAIAKALNRNARGSDKPSPE